MSNHNHMWRSQAACAVLVPYSEALQHFLYHWPAHRLPLPTCTFSLNLLQMLAF
jgi:hypothetical protein